MENFEKILFKYNWPKRTEKLQVSFEELEDISGFKLPDDYKNYVQNYFPFEESIGPEYVCLWNYNELLDINRGYQIFENLPNTLAIGGNGSGEFIGLEHRKNRKLRLILSPIMDLNTENHIKIGNSFSDFLDRLDKGKEWFE